MSLYDKPWVKKGDEATRYIKDYVSGDGDANMRVWYDEAAGAFCGEYQMVPHRRSGICTVCDGEYECEKCDLGDLVEEEPIDIEGVDDAVDLDDATAKADAWLKGYTG